MKIFIFRETELKNLTPEVIENKGVGGTDSCTVSLASEFAKNGHIVQVSCPCSYGFYDNVEYIPFTSYGLVRLQIGTFDPDILIVSGNPQIFLDGPFNVKKIFFWHHNHPDELGRFPMHEILRIPKMIYVFPSIESAEFGKWYYKSDRIAGVYNGIRSCFFNTTKIKKKDEIVYVGSLTRAKGVLELLKVKEKIPWPVRICGGFDMYGFVDESYKKYCEPYLKDIEMMGTLPPKELASVVARAQLCIVNPLIGNKETCCISALEAMAVGTCVVAGGNSLIDPIIHRGGVTYLNDIPTIISDLMRMGDVRDNLAIQGKKWVKNITWGNVAKRWEELLFR